jgi:hypothetical protein
MGSTGAQGLLGWCQVRAAMARFCDLALLLIFDFFLGLIGLYEHKTVQSRRLCIWDKVVFVSVSVEGCHQHAGQAIVLCAASQSLYWCGIFRSHTLFPCDCSSGETTTFNMFCLELI